MKLFRLKLFMTGLLSPHHDEKSLLPPEEGVVPLRCFHGKRYPVFLGVWLAVAGCAIIPRGRFVKTLTGTIKNNRLLSGKILVTGDILVPRGVTLTLAPGTVLKFAQSRKTAIDPDFLFNTHELLVRGRLIARGTARLPIRFTGEKKITRLWAGIIFDHSRKSTLNNCFIGQAEYGVYAIASDVRLHKVTIDQVQYGLVAQKDSALETEGLTISRAEVGISCPRKLAAMLSARIW
ncbi:MAG: hypothetical protein ACE5GM_08335 [bacterium]